MVSVDSKETYELFIPGVVTKRFRGVSLAEQLDNVALHLMEHVPRWPIRRMSELSFCPYIELRKVKVEIDLRPLKQKLKKTWTGRFAVVVSRWPSDGFYTATIPRLSTERFAMMRTAHLEHAVKHFVEKWVEETGDINLDPFTCQSYDYLEILDVEVDYPTILPSRPKQQKKKKKKKNKDNDPKEKRKRQIVPPTTLREVGLNLSHRAMDDRLPPAFGRDVIVKQILQLLQRDGAAILLVGPSGVGKTAIIHEVIRALAAQELPLQERCDVWEVDGNRLIAGMSVVGAWEQRCQNMVNELHARNDILYVNDLPSLVYTGRSAHSDTHVAQYLEPHIARGDFRILGECTPERLEATREEAPGFFARFRILQIPELPEKDTLTVLVHAMRRFEALDDLVISADTLMTTLALTRRFQAHECFPGKAITLMRRLMSDHQDITTDSLGRRSIQREQLVRFFERQTGLPGFILWEQQSRSTHDISAHFRRRIIAQQAAVESVTDIVVTLQQGLNDPERPLATMLFVGPTGVGKTETAKALAAYLFGREDRMIRFDMSEFMDSWAVSRLIGDRWQPDGELTRRVQQQPFSVILLDEIEKGHPAVFDALLQVLGEGRLTNAAGRTVNFCNTVVIMTSNLGVREANRSLGFAGPDEAQMDTHYRKAAEGFFRPEFFNRIDRIVPFRRLGRDAIAPLVERLIQDILSRRGLRRSQVMVQVDPALVELLIDLGFDPQYGARSMKRLLEQQLTVPLAQRLVESPPSQNSLIQVFDQNKEITMEIWNLEEPTVDLLPSLQPIKKWEELKPNFENISTSFHNLIQQSFIQDLTHEHTRLLGEFNALQKEEHPLTLLPHNEQERLLFLGELLDEMRQLQHVVDHFQDEYLATFQYQEVLERGVYGQPDYDMSRLRTDFVSEQPVEADTQRLMPLARQALNDLRLRLAGLLFRANHAHDAEDTQALLRFLPGTDDPHTRVQMLSFAYAFSLCWQRWAGVQFLILGPQGWEAWQQDASTDTLADFLNDKNTPKSRWYDVKGVALSISGPGIKTLLKEELGFWLYTYSSGPDQLCDLLRIEDVSLQASPYLEAYQNQAASEAITTSETTTSAAQTTTQDAAHEQTSQAIEANEANDAEGAEETIASSDEGAPYETSESSEETDTSETSETIEEMDASETTETSEDHQLGAPSETKGTGATTTVETPANEEIKRYERALCRALQALDKEHQDYLEARRQKLGTPNPRPVLPLRRLFHEHLSLDPLTGEELDLNIQSRHNTLRTELLGQLADTMFRIAMYRVLATYL
ncbi:MAG: ATP-dependent Clp protease ATP-binding subunit [Myxococcales bacterium]|nr:ATP-dependent Clp protease ATP-binding subunit [Myxococcales bacterium]